MAAAVVVEGEGEGGIPELHLFDLHIDREPDKRRCWGVEPRGSLRQGNTKSVNRRPPRQSAIRFTVHEIWSRFYWSKDLSLIIYWLLPGLL